MSGTMRENLQRLIDERGVSVNELARRVGVRSDTTIGRWLKGETEPRLSEVLALARFFGVGLLDLLGDDAVDVGRGLTGDEAEVVELVRSMIRRGWSYDEVFRRLLGAPASQSPTADPKPKNNSAG